MLNERVIENVAKTVDNITKVVHFVKEYEEEDKKRDEIVEGLIDSYILALDQYDAQPDYFKDQGYSKPSLLVLGFRQRMDTLRSVKRGYNRKLNNYLQKIMTYFDRYQQVPAKYQTVRGLRNLMIIYKAVYMKLKVLDIHYGTMLKDDLIFKGSKQISAETAVIFDNAMREMVDSHGSVETAKNLVKKVKEGKKETKDLLSQYFKEDDDE